MKEAARNNLYSGSTAAVVLLVEGKILVANIGDSKALICSEKFQSPAEAKGQKHTFSAFCFVPLVSNFVLCSHARLCLIMKCGKLRQS